MINKIICQDFDMLLKRLFKMDYFSSNNLTDYNKYLDNMTPSYEEIVNKAYQKYFKKMIDIVETGDET